MQKIQSITLRNFKFFYSNETEQKQNKIELNQNNLLLYGENGSGKSSIYWALYTFLQSCKKKSDADIKKYFDTTHNENLRNRFAKDTDDSAIILEIVYENGARTKEISNKKLETNKTTDTTVDKIIAGSDFINYKFLSKLYDFRNSQEIDLFDWLEREVLMFVEFGSYTNNQGDLSTSNLASDWWDFICGAPKTFTPNKKNTNTAKRNSPEYFRLVNTTLPKFIELLKAFLTKITIKTNQILKDDFKEYFKVDFDVSSINSIYNNWIGENNVSRPTIPLKVIFNHESLEVF